MVCEDFRISAAAPLPTRVLVPRSQEHERDRAPTIPYRSRFLFRMERSVGLDRITEIILGGTPGAMTLASSGGPAPGLDPLLFDDGTTWKPLQISNSGEALFLASLDTSAEGVESWSRDCIWRWDDVQTELVARSGDPAPEGPDGAAWFRNIRNEFVTSDGKILMQRDIRILPDWSFPPGDGCYVWQRQGDLTSLLISPDSKVRLANGTEESVACVELGARPSASRGRAERPGPSTPGNIWP